MPEDSWVLSTRGPAGSREYYIQDYREPNMEGPRDVMGSGALVTGGDRVGLGAWEELSSREGRNQTWVAVSSISCTGQETVAFCP